MTRPHAAVPLSAPRSPAALSFAAAVSAAAALRSARRVIVDTAQPGGWRDVDFVVRGEAGVGVTFRRALGVSLDLTGGLRARLP